MRFNGLDSAATGSSNVGDPLFRLKAEATRFILSTICANRVTFSLGRSKSIQLNYYYSVGVAVSIEIVSRTKTFKLTSSSAPRGSPEI